MNPQFDLFSSKLPRVQMQPKGKSLPLRVKILEFFKERKYQSFTPAELPAHFLDHNPKAVRNAIAHLEKTRHLVSTGQHRGDKLGVDNYCVTLNLHRR